MLKTMATHPFRFLTISALGALGLTVWAFPPQHSGAAGQQKARPAAARLAYPVAKLVEQVDDYHGTKVSDPYRWLESLDSPETRKWVDAVLKVAAAESEHNREVLAAWTRDWSGRAASALLPVVELALGPQADAAVAEYVAALSARIAKAGIPA